MGIMAVAVIVAHGLKEGSKFVGMAVDVYNDVVQGFKIYGQEKIPPSINIVLSKFIYQVNNLSILSPHHPIPDQSSQGHSQGNQWPPCPNPCQ